MLHFTRMSTLKGSLINRSATRRLKMRYSSAASLAHQVSEEAERGQRHLTKPTRIPVSPGYSLRRSDHLKEIVERHMVELRKAYDLLESPEVALAIPQGFQFAPEKEALETEAKPEESVRPLVKKKVQTIKAPAKKSGKETAAHPTVKNQAQYEAQRNHILSSLRSYVDVSVQVGQYECALNAVNYNRWYLKKLHQRLAVGPPEPFPIDIYNILLSGCAEVEDFELANEVKTIMTWDNVNLNALSYAYLIACARGKNDILGLMKGMSDARITLDDLFLKTPLTEDLIKKLVRNIRSCDQSHDFEIPAFDFPSNQTCELVAKVKQRRVPFTADRLFEPEFLREKAAQQIRREVAGYATLKSVVASENPSEHVEFLRQQVAKCEDEWRNELGVLFDAHLEEVTNQALHRHEMSVYPFLLSLEKPVFIDLMLDEMRTRALASEGFSMSLAYLALQLGRKVENLYHIRTKVKTGVHKAEDQIYQEYLKEFDPRHTTPGREMWQSLISKNPYLAPCIENRQESPWSKSTCISVGRALYTLLRRLKFDVNILQHNRKREMMNAIYSVYRSTAERTTEELKPHRVLAMLYRRADLRELHFDTTFLPMLCPPKPWCHARSTPFLIARTPLMRSTSDVTELQQTVLTDEPMEKLYPPLDALNVLSRTPWRVNKPVLEVLTAIFRDDGDDKLSIPRNPNKMVQPDTSGLSEAAIRKEFFLFRRLKNETYSLWCDMLYKLSIANHFKDEIFFFPHNMDFRGRVYPVPPHFTHLGGDSIRSLFLFAEGKPIGKDGLRWLKLHLINLTGFKKRQSIEERIAYADMILDDILDSAENPLTGRKWWQTSDDPWQTLAVCKEIANALASPDPEKYVCHLPIHQDGSCNGLQHYAALGRDLEGALQVNLIPRDRPQDVYSGIADIVEQMRKEDSLLNSEPANLLEGRISRKVVKQTVMTVVYGVTRFGAHLQILKQINELEGFPPQKASAAARYLVGKTFSSLEKMFTATRKIQNWLTDCAKSISGVVKEPVKWTTPLGLPVVQPYYVSAKHKNLLKSGGVRSAVRIASTEPHFMKQKNGFPPNYIHSLDSSHMMLTAIHCEAAGMTFVSIHDCFWTHVPSVDTMNEICREQFLALHSLPLLEQLADEFRRNYCRERGQSTSKPSSSSSSRSSEIVQLHELLNRIPERGEYKLEEVLKSRYFFS